jgi:hypothetical protein
LSLQIGFSGLNLEAAAGVAPREIFKLHG